MDIVSDHEQEIKPAESKNAGNDGGASMPGWSARPVATEATQPTPRNIWDEWALGSEALADWTSANMVNRTDTYGGYVSPDKRKNGNAVYTSKRPLTIETIRDHFVGNQGDQIGLHAIARDEASGHCSSRWVGIDIDRHGEDGDATVNFQFAQSVQDAATAAGFKPLLMDSDGRGGFHIVIHFDGLTESAKAQAYGEWLVRGWQSAGLTTKPEVFPKQSSLEKGGFGSWLRLPGRHHSRRHFTKVWDAAADSWLEGRDAVEAIVSTVGTSADKIPAEALTWAAQQRQQSHASHTLGSKTTVCTPKPAGSPGRTLRGEDRFRSYLSKINQSKQGDRGSDQLYKAACVGVEFGLDHETILRIIQSDYNIKGRCVPVWPEGDVRHKIDDAFKNATHGRLLDAPCPPSSTRMAPPFGLDAAAGMGDDPAERGKAKEANGPGEMNGRLIMGDNGPRSCAHNSRILLEGKGEGWARYDTFRRVVLLGGDPMTDQTVIDLTMEIEADKEVPWSQEHVRSAALYLAHKNEFSSLTEYLSNLQWDGVPRIELFFSDHYEVAQTAYHAEVSRLIFLPAVARAYQPGCKVDTVPILIGKQGCGKSRGIAALCPQADWFTDDIGNDLFAGKAGEGLQGKWIIELAELARVNRSTVEVVKSFISRPVDRYRPPYGRIAQDFPRTCVFVGSTNDDQPLEDTENRRYLPIWVGEAEPGRIADARDQLWAEAVHRYKGGEEWWTISSNLIKEAAQQVRTARKTDAWSDVLRDQLEGREQTTMIDAARLVGITTDRLSRSEQIRVGIALKTIGFAVDRASTGDRQRFYVRSPSNLTLDEN